MEKWITYAFLILSAKMSFAFEPLPLTAPAPSDNPTTAEKVELGRQLFFDPRLSHTGTVSCNSCHNVMAGGEDGRPTSFGVFGKQGGRSAPTVWNAAFLSVQFWDGRAASLEDQAKGPITNPVEMGMKNHDLVVKRVAQIPGYRDQFEKVFSQKNSINIDNIAKAIAAYERTLITPNSPFDRYLKGDERAISSNAKRGSELVKSVGCVACHSGPNYSGPVMPVGQGFFQKFPVNPVKQFEEKYAFSKDSGRFAVTKNSSDRNMWRVPTWRNVALTAPYFHNGSVRSLSEAVQIMAKAQLKKDLPPQDIKDIVAFLESLTGDFPEQKLPRLPAAGAQSMVE